MTRTQENELENYIKSELKDIAGSIDSNTFSVTDMAKVISLTDNISLTKLNEWERFIRDEFSCLYRTGAVEKPGRWHKFIGLPERKASWLDLVSWDGRQREKALQTLVGSVPNSFFCMLLIRRLNDWVPQVRLAARQALPAIMQQSNRTHIVNALWGSLPHWSSWQRMGDEDKNALLAVIADEQIGAELKDKIITAFNGPVGSLFNQIGRTSTLDVYLEEIASYAIQPGVRAKAYRTLLDGKISWCEGRSWEWTDKRYCEGRFVPVVASRKLTVSTPLLDTLKSASLDPSAVVRRVAAEILIRELDNLGDGARSMVEQFTADKWPSVAERGRFALKRLAE